MTVASRTLHQNTRRNVSNFLGIFVSGCLRIAKNIIGTRAVPLLGNCRRSLLKCRFLHRRVGRNNFMRLVRGNFKPCVFSGPFTGTVQRFKTGRFTGLVCDTGGVCSRGHTSLRGSESSRRFVTVCRRCRTFSRLRRRFVSVRRSMATQVTRCISGRVRRFTRVM